LGADGVTDFCAKTRGRGDLERVRIGWVNDFAVGSHPGGSTSTQGRAITAAPERAEIVMCSPEAGVDEACDLYVVNNFGRFPLKAVEFLRDCGRMVWWLHDCTPPDWMIRTRGVPTFADAAKRVAFLSPMHMEVMRRAFGVSVGKRRLRYAPCMVDPDPFLSQTAPRDCRPRDAFWMGTYEYHRGPRAALLWAEENGIILDFYGFGEPPAYLMQSESARVYGAVGAYEVPALMGMYRRFVYMPGEAVSIPGDEVYVEACGRTAVEALLAGCEVVSNGMLGVMSWPWFGVGREATAAAMREAPGQFWQMVMAVEDD